MKRTLLLSTFILSFSICAVAQDADKAFAITGNGKGDFNWMNIRQIDLSTGLVTKNIFENGITNFQMRNVATESEVLSSQQNGKQIGVPEYPTDTMVASAAYDKK